MKLKLEPIAPPGAAQDLGLMPLPEDGMTARTEYDPEMLPLRGGISAVERFFGCRCRQVNNRTRPSLCYRAPGIPPAVDARRLSPTNRHMILPLHGQIVLNS
jgi:hypothetical protein